MPTLELADVKDLVAYEKVREQMRADVIALKRDRRISVGDNLTLLFENRATVLFQVQEMIRTERIVDEAKIQEELDAYNPLLPGPGELSATLFIEIPGIARMSQAEVHAAVNRFQGLDQGAIRLVVGAHDSAARFEGGRTKEEKMAAVQFVRFAVGDDMRAALAAGREPVAIVVDHPAYQARADVPEPMRRQLADDLRTA